MKYGTTEKLSRKHSTLIREIVLCVIVAVIAFIIGKSSTYTGQFLVVQPQVTTDKYFESYYLTVNYANGRGFTACFYTPQELNEFTNLKFVKAGSR